MTQGPATGNGTVHMALFILPGVYSAELTTGKFAAEAAAIEKLSTETGKTVSECTIRVLKKRYVLRCLERKSTRRANNMTSAWSLCMGSKIGKSSY